MTIREKMNALADQLELASTGLKDQFAPPEVTIGAVRQHVKHLAHQLDDLEYEAKHPPATASGTNSLEVLP